MALHEGGAANGRVMGEEQGVMVSCMAMGSFDENMGDGAERPRDNVVELAPASA